MDWRKRQSMLSSNAFSFHDRQATVCSRRSIITVRRNCSNRRTAIIARFMVEA